jgi:hypothetical protein
MCFSISFPGELLGLERGVRLRLGRAVIPMDGLLQSPS